MYAQLLVRTRASGRRERRRRQGDEGTASKRALRHSPSQAANLSETSGFKTLVLTLGHRLVYTLSGYSFQFFFLYRPPNEALRCFARARARQLYERFYSVYDSNSYFFYYFFFLFAFFQLKFTFSSQFTYFYMQPFFLPNNHTKLISLTTTYFQMVLVLVTPCASDASSPRTQDELSIGGSTSLSQTKQTSGHALHTTLPSACSASPVIAGASYGKTSHRPCLYLCSAPVRAV